MKEFEKSKKVYESIKIPNELQYKVKDSLKQPKKQNIWLGRTVKILASASAICIVFATLVNTNQAFAKTMSEIPVLANLAKFFHIHEINESNEYDVITAKIPNIENTGNKEFEEKINTKINQKMNEILDITRIEAKEFKKMAEDYEEEYIYEPINVSIDYEIKSQKDGILSFVIIEQQSDKMHANVHQQKFMYTVDLNQNKELTLQDLLGENYKEIIDTQIEQQIEEILKKDESAFFKKDDFPILEHGWGFEGIHEGQKFYINENGNVVIAFDKYEISPGYMGTPEFEIIK